MMKAENEQAVKSYSVETLNTVTLDDVEPVALTSNIVR